MTRGSNFPSSTNPVSCVEAQVVRIASRMQTQNDNHNGSGLQRSMVIDIHKHKYFIINTKCVVLCTNVPFFFAAAKKSNKMSGYTRREQQFSHFFQLCGMRSQ